MEIFKFANMLRIILLHYFNVFMYNLCDLFRGVIYFCFAITILIFDWFYLSCSEALSNILISFYSYEIDPKYSYPVFSFRILQKNGK